MRKSNRHLDAFEDKVLHELQSLTEAWGALHKARCVDSDCDAAIKVAALVANGLGAKATLANAERFLRHLEAFEKMDGERERQEGMAKDLSEAFERMLGNIDKAAKEAAKA